MKLFIRLFLFVSFIISTFSDSNIQRYDPENFPKDIVALHMPCEESNFFQTKCMCHIVCTTPECSNAEKICSKYSTSRGCKFMLIRNIGKNIVATLKRVPTNQEYQSFSVDNYPVSEKEFLAWKLKNYPTPPNFQSNKLIDLYHSTLSSPYILAELKKPNPSQYCHPWKDSSPQLLPSSQEISSSFPILSSPLSLLSKSLTSPSQPPSSSSSISQSDSNFLSQGITLVLLSYHAPLTLANTLRSWKEGGLLSMVTERLAFISDPSPQDRALIWEHGFTLIEPKTIKDVIMVKPNVMTIGQAFYQALKIAKNEFILFMENDFKLDLSLTKETIQSELLAGSGLLWGGIEVIRFQSRSYQGCGTFKHCNHNSQQFLNPNVDERKRNWFSFYCSGHPGTSHLVSDCLGGIGSGEKGGNGGGNGESLEGKQISIMKRQENESHKGTKKNSKRETNNFNKNDQLQKEFKEIMKTNNTNNIIHTQQQQQQRENKRQSQKAFFIEQHKNRKKQTNNNNTIITNNNILKDSFLPSKTTTTTPPLMMMTTPSIPSQSSSSMKNSQENRRVLLSSSSSPSSSSVLTEINHHPASTILLSTSSSSFSSSNSSTSISTSLLTSSSSSSSSSSSIKVPHFRCFTSYDSNWSLNAALVRKSTMINKKYKTARGKMKSIFEIALESSKKQDALESNMAWGDAKWMNWKVPICISYQGLFIHEEIETGT